MATAIDMTAIPKQRQKSLEMLIPIPRRQSILKKYIARDERMHTLEKAGLGAEGSL